MQTEEAQGIALTFDFANNNANTFPQLRDNINADEGYRRFAELAGFPLDLINPPKETNNIREAQSEALEEQVIEVTGNREEGAGKDIYIEFLDSEYSVFRNLSFDGRPSAAGLSSVAPEGGRR